MRASALPRLLRDAWLIAGLSLLLLAALEVGARLWPEPVEPPDPSAPAPPQTEAPWWPAWAAVRDSSVYSQGVVYDPYRGWLPRPVEAPGLVIGPDHLRRTLDPAAGAPRRVVFLGGSVMWGYTVRDAHTIPSLVAERLARAGRRDVAVLNLAQSAYNATQDLTTFALYLRDAPPPLAAVFLNGVNELGVPHEGGAPGEIYDLAGARQRFERGYRLDELWLASRLRIVRRLVERPRPQRSAPLPAEQLCATIAAQYRRLAELGSAMGRAAGVETFFLWQPTLAASHKPHGPWEEYLMREAGDPGAMRLVALTRACVAEVDRSMSSAERVHYASLNGVFDQTPGDVFVDHYGHVTERGNAILADEIARRLAALL